MTRRKVLCTIGAGPHARLLDLLGHDISSEPIRLVHRRRLAAHVADLDLSFNSIPRACPAPDPVVDHYAACSQEEREQRIAADVTAAMPRLGGAPRDQSMGSGSRGSTVHDDEPRS